MKIAWIVPGFQSDAADWCIPALTLLAQRVAAEHDLSVYALQYPGRDDRYSIGPVSVSSFGVGVSGRVPKIGRIRPILRALKELRQLRPDVIHSFWAAEPALVGRMAARRTHAPLIAACMGGEPANVPEIRYGAWRNPLDRFYLRLAAGAAVLTTGSDYQAGFLRARLGAKVSLVPMPLGVDTQRFRPLAKELAPEPCILAVGSLLPVKGHAQLIAAVAHIPGVRLRIVGEGQERARLAQVIAEYGVADRVTLAGNVGYAQMPAEYQAADAIMLSSYYESQCMALLEGLACGLPAVSAPAGLAPTLLADGAAGELADGNSPAALAAALSRLLNRRASWAKIRQAARATAEAYSLDVCSRRLCDLYARLGAKNNVYEKEIAR